MERKEYEYNFQKLLSEKAELTKALISKDNELAEFRRLEDKIKEEHSLIPKSYKTIEEWLEGHPFPDSVNCMRFESYAIAREVQISSNTYYFDYHIVKTK
ncbi:Uncharacterised protein [Chryseobacterium gleum]|uniref:Uncharacterized protein n=2 Tax=Chryseobacterium gleum TaxID=250 RepID=A0A3S4QZE7_CHRGE|nr:hypothetical protein [Chryseobacterium gleum]QQY32076.1 hypothetical protein I6I60_25145 [Chryseobacterium gleum]VEE10703.1 Uncharacterised protein [Chryseobacterium gleum]